MVSEVTASPFQVDLRGVVDLLSRHIYSSPQVFLRELLQNGRDAVAARHRREELSSSRPAQFGIRITPVSSSSPYFVLRDDGIGLSIEEVGELLATVGRSSKRDVLDLPNRDFLGRFGIGLLSAFMVSDRIVVRSRSADGAASAVEWIGTSDGTYTAREMTVAETEGRAVGTEVILEPRPDDAALLGTSSVLRLARRYGEFLDLPVQVELPDGSLESINRAAVFLEPIGREADLERALEFGRELIGAQPLGVVPLGVRETATRGMAFVLPFSPPPGARRANRVYAGRMLVSERSEDVLPDWAIFVRICIDTDGLDPTASREQLVDNDALELTREQIGASIRRWVLQLAANEPIRLAEFLAVHEVALKALVLHDDELARCLLPWFSIETSVGRQMLGELVRRGAHLRYAATVDEFRQVAALAPADDPILNGGYLYLAEIMERLPFLFDGLQVERVSVSREIDRLDPPGLRDRVSALRLEEGAARALRATGVAVVVRCFAPEDLPALFVADPEVLRAIERERAREVSSGLWNSVVSRLEDFAANHPTSYAAARGQGQLCLNWTNGITRVLAGNPGESAFDRTVQLLYVQALLAGHRPLRPVDRALLTTALSDLIQLTLDPQEGSTS